MLDQTTPTPPSRNLHTSLLNAGSALGRRRFVAFLSGAAFSLASGKLTLASSEPAAEDELQQACWGEVNYCIRCFSGKVYECLCTYDAGGTGQPCSWTDCHQKYCAGKVCQCNW